MGLFEDVSTYEFILRFKVDLEHNVQVAVNKAVLIWDGRCGFCRIWVDYWRLLTVDRVEYRTSQDAQDDFKQIPPEAFSEAVQLVRSDGSVASGAAAVFESLGKVRLYRMSRIAAAISEACYRFVARRRSLFYQITRFTFGTRIEPARFASTQWLFIRLLALVYAIAFASLGVQVLGLYGAQGILPIRDFLAAIARSFGFTRYFAVPTLFWWGAGDETLVGLSIAGAVMAALLVVTGFRKGIFERLLLILLFLVYLSFSAAGQDFLSFQWDSLLLEAGFLAIFLGRTKTPAWLFRWLVFRLHFLSGSVKLLSQDASWRDLTALHYHYYTQPLPTAVAWYMEQLPLWFQRASTLSVLMIELLIPFLIFAPRLWRIFGAFCLLGLQVMIFLTGNYGFFNLLTMVLCLFLFDDQALDRFVPAQVRDRLTVTFALKPGKPERIAIALAAVVVLTLGLTLMLESFTGDAPAPLIAMTTAAAPFEIVNSYGLFAVMSKSRPEIILEGSIDGQTWVPYEFPYKPGDVRQPPRWVAPHMPRLDWQMWFAALSTYRSNSWFVSMAIRLLEGSQPVTALLVQNPFPGSPPKFIRAMAYDYTFTDWETRKRTGAWWKREPKGEYLPPIGLRNGAP